MRNYQPFELGTQINSLRPYTLLRGLTKNGKWLFLRCKGIQQDQRSSSHQGRDTKFLESDKVQEYHEREKAIMSSTRQRCHVVLCAGIFQFTFAGVTLQRKNLGTGDISSSSHKEQTLSILREPNPEDLIKS